MRVVVAFDNLPDLGDLGLGDAFWLADSPSNRELAEAAWSSRQYDPNSAVFERPSRLDDMSHVIELLDDIDLHHPNWREIKFTGLMLSTALKAALEGRDCTAENVPHGLSLKR